MAVGDLLILLRLGGVEGILRRGLLLQWGFSQRGIIVREVHDGGGRWARGVCFPRMGSGGRWRGLRAAWGAPGEAGEVSGSEEGRPEDIAARGAPGGLASDEGCAVEQPPEISGRHVEGRRRGWLRDQEERWRHGAL